MYNGTTIDSLDYIYNLDTNTIENNDIYNQASLLVIDNMENESDNLDIKHAKILSFKSREKYFKNKNNNRKNILFSFSYFKHPNFHKKKDGKGSKLH